MSILKSYVTTSLIWPDIRISSSGTNLFGVFSCVWNCADSVCSDSTCKVWEGWLSAVWAIGYSDWLCASCMTILIGGVPTNQRGVWEDWTLWCAFCFSMHSVPSFPVFMFWSTGTRLAPPAVTEAYCISCKCRTYTLLWSWQPSKQFVQCNFSVKVVRREVMEWLDEGSWLLVWVWVVCGGTLTRQCISVSCFTLTPWLVGAFIHMTTMMMMIYVCALDVNRGPWRGWCELYFTAALTGQRGPHASRSLWRRLVVQNNGVFYKRFMFSLTQS